MSYEYGKRRAPVRDLRFALLDQRIGAARSQVSRACLSCLRGDLAAPLQVRDALFILDTLQRDLAALEESNLEDKA